MICGLVCSIGMLIVEMALFIVRAVQVERVYENKKPLNDADQAAYRPQLAVQTAFTPPDLSMSALGFMDNQDDEEPDTWEDSDLMPKDALSKKSD